MAVLRQRGGAAGSRSNGGLAATEQGKGWGMSGGRRSAALHCMKFVKTHTSVSGIDDCDTAMGVRRFRMKVTAQLLR
jgi:hypothetical protein